ncbi:ATP-binding cassette domain-containing protein [candidate division WOR-3 bacterium]|nr:ATP-binding cassette domain-containing protein [candidate division WOR-3 bacterium]
MELVSENISFSWDKGKLLSGISVEISQGKIISLSGEMASGKSTLLFLLSGLLRPASGNVRCIDEKGVDCEAADFTGLIRQEIFNQIAFTTSCKELKFSASLKRTGHSKTLDDIKKIQEVWSLRSEATYKMSYFELLKLFSAGFILSGKKLILFDEVFVNLSSAERHFFTQNLFQSGVGALFVTQFPGFFKGISHRHYHLKDGNIIEKDLSEFRPVHIQPLMELFRKNECFFSGSDADLRANMKDFLSQKYRISYLPNYSERLFFYADIQKELSWRGIDPVKFLEKLKSSGLNPEIADKDPFHISSGQRRTIAACFALCRQPKVIFIENPLLHFDSPRLSWLADELSCFVSEGGKVFYSSPLGDLGKTSLA